MLPRPVLDAAKEIGAFYLHKHKGDHKATEWELVNLRITKLEVNGNFLCITAGRIGMLIGKRGQNIDELSKHIERTMQMQVKVFEDTDCLYDYLIPRKDDDFD